ncbi:hypothetical protein M422DRAFT_169828, partial [Sphaerobolus stellatus SS14]
STLLLAGHEITASTMTWLLDELSRNEDIQEKLERTLENHTDVEDQKSLQFRF